MTTGARTSECHRYLLSRQALTSGSPRIGQASKSGTRITHQSQCPARNRLARLANQLVSNDSFDMFKYATVVLLFLSGTLASKMTSLSATCETLPSTVHITKGESSNETIGG